jgi:hypothetical protein
MIRAFQFFEGLAAVIKDQFYIVGPNLRIPYRRHRVRREPTPHERSLGMGAALGHASTPYAITTIAGLLMLRVELVTRRVESNHRTRWRGS